MHTAIAVFNPMQSTAKNAAFVAVNKKKIITFPLK
jgi:hypothetical protein